jgi:hypothetical protein
MRAAAVLAQLILSMLAVLVAAVLVRVQAD